jgi:hypothetical protein
MPQVSCASTAVVLRASRRITVLNPMRVQQASRAWDAHADAAPRVAPQARRGLAYPASLHGHPACPCMPSRRLAAMRPSPRRQPRFADPAGHKGSRRAGADSATGRAVHRRAGWRGAERGSIAGRQGRGEAGAPSQAPHALPLARPVEGWGAREWSTGPPSRGWLPRGGERLCAARPSSRSKHLPHGRARTAAAAVAVLLMKWRS